MPKGVYVRTAKHIEDIRARFVGREVSEETRQKLRNVMLAEWSNPVSRNKRILSLRASMTPELKKKLSIAHLGKSHKITESGRRKLQESGFRLWRDPEIKAKMEIGFRSYVNSPKGKATMLDNTKYIHTPESRRKVALARTGVPLSPQHRENIRCALKGKPKSIEHREKLRQSVLKQKPTWRTSIEKILESSFEELGLEFECNVSIFGRFKPDFVFHSAKLIVEADGEYWHSLPDKVERDKLLDKIAFEQGWTVFHFPGTRIHEDLESCLVQVCNFLRR